MDETELSAGWVMVREEIPTEAYLPGGSIHYARPWPIRRENVPPLERKGSMEIRKPRAQKRWDDHPVDAEVAPPSGKGAENEIQTFGKEPNYKGARAIFFNGNKIRVFPHEVTPIASESLVENYAKHSHHWVPDTALDEQLADRLKKGIFYMRSRGVSKSWALVKMMEGIADERIPPIGWWQMYMGYKVSLGLDF